MGLDKLRFQVKRCLCITWKVDANEDLELKRDVWAGDIRQVGSILGLGTPLGGGHGNPLQYSCLENPHGQRSPMGYSPYGGKESDMTECLRTQHRAFITLH